MIRYILKRLLILIPIILAISFIVFAIMSFSPGDPVRMMLGTNADPADAEALREQLGLNDPFLVQYFNYIKNAVLHLDFGTSYTTKQPVFNDIIGRFPTTVTLTVGGIIIAVVVSLPIGIISAIKQYSLMDNITVFMSMAFTAIPNVWLGLMLMLLFSYTLGWLPSSGIDSPLGYILPMITLAALAIALYIRMTRSSMLEVIRMDYVRTAKGKGIGNLKTTLHHEIRNALLPVITVIGMDFGYMLGGAIVIENVFAVPGLGRLMVDAIRAKNTPVVLAGVIFTATVFSLVNLITDVVYAYIDPRIKAEYTAKSAKKLSIKKYLRDIEERERKEAELDAAG